MPPHSSECQSGQQHGSRFGDGLLRGRDRCGTSLPLPNEKIAAVDGAVVARVALGVGGGDGRPESCFPNDEVGVGYLRVFIEVGTGLELIENDVVRSGGAQGARRTVVHAERAEAAGDTYPLPVGDVGERGGNVVDRGEK